MSPPPVAGTAAGYRSGILMMAGACLGWSTSGLIVRHTSIANGWEVTFWRSLFCCVTLSAWLLVRYGGGAAARVRAIGRIGVVSALLFAVMFTAFLLALTRTTVANTQVLVSVAPLFAAIAGFAFQGERVPARTWCAIVCAFGGILVMFSGALGGGAMSGNLFALLVPLAFAAQVVLLKRTGTALDMLPAVLLGGVFSALLTLPLALPLSASAHDLALLALMGAVQLALPCVLMTWAAPLLSAAEAGLIQLVETICAPLWVWLAVGEEPGAATLLGGGIVIAALVVNETLGLRSTRAARVAQ